MMLVTCYGTQNTQVPYLTISLYLIITCSPETIESLFIAYRLTGDDRYREYGWNIFQSIEKYCRLESGGYVSILDVDNVDSRKIDKMETFFLVCFIVCLMWEWCLRCAFFLERDSEVSLLTLLWSKCFTVGQYVFSQCLYYVLHSNLTFFFFYTKKNTFSIQRYIPFLAHSHFLPLLIIFCFLFKGHPFPKFEPTTKANF